MEENIAKTLLAEFREFRAENEERWKENNKRWEENDKRWEQNEKRWEENNKRWEQNERRWEENNKRWEKNERRWEENNAHWELNDNKLVEMNMRIENLEKNREKDRRDILEVLDTMQKSISKRFDDMQEYMDSHFERIYSVQISNSIEHLEFKRAIKENSKRINFQNSKIDNLEKWKDKLENGNFYSV